MTVRSMIVVLLCTASAVFVAGCSRGQTAQQQDNIPLDRGPGYELLPARSQQVTDALDAAGGPASWTAAKKIEFKGVVTVYHPDGSRYLTEHHYCVYPWSRSVRIRADEPMGRFVWEMVNGRFAVVEGSDAVDVAQMQLSASDYIESVLKLVAAPTELWQGGISAAGADPGRIRGLWYRILEQHPTGAVDLLRSRDILPAGVPARHWSRILYYQNTDSGLLEIVCLIGRTEQKMLTVRGYDYKSRATAGVLVPSKMEVFEAEPQDILAKRLLTIDVE